MKSTSSFIIFRPDPILADLIENTPKNYSRFFMVSTIRIVTLIIGVLLSILGIGLIVEGLIQSQLFSVIIAEYYSTSIQNIELVTGVTFYCGIVAFGLGLLFLTISRLSKIVLSRNRYHNLLLCRQAELNEFVASQEHVKQETRKMSEQLNARRA